MLRSEIERNISLGVVHLLKASTVKKFDKKKERSCGNFAEENIIEAKAEAHCNRVKRVKKEKGQMDEKNAETVRVMNESLVPVEEIGYGRTSIFAVSRVALIMVK